MKYFFIFSSLIVFLLTACTKQQGAALIQRNALLGRNDSLAGGCSIIGSWRWILQYNDGNYSGNLSSFPGPDSLTPQNTGLEKTLIFYSDSVWSLVINGNITAGGRFSFKQILTPAWPITVLDLMNQNGQDSLVNHTLGCDTLSTSNILIVDTQMVNVYIRE